MKSIIQQLTATEECLAQLESLIQAERENLLSCTYDNRRLTEENLLLKDRIEQLEAEMKRTASLLSEKEGLLAERDRQIAEQLATIGQLKEQLDKVETAVIEPEAATKPKDAPLIRKRRTRRKDKKDDRPDPTQLMFDFD